MQYHEITMLTMADGTQVPLAYYFGAMLKLRGADPAAYEALRRNINGTQSAGEFDPLQFAELAYGFYLCGMIAQGGGPHVLNDAMAVDDFMDLLPDDMDAFMDAMLRVMHADPKAQGATPSAAPAV